MYDNRVVTQKGPCKCEKQESVCVCVNMVSGVSCILLSENFVVAAVENNMDAIGETVPSPMATVHCNNLVKGFFFNSSG